MPKFSEITPSQLMRLVGTPNCPTILDVCTDTDFNADPYLIPGTQRWPHGRIEQYASGPAVVVCQKGKKLSHGAAALLRAKGIKAEVLEGGIYAWRDAGLPRVPAQALPGPLWVTRHRPKIDRIACPWLIRRFIDPHAKFLFVPPSEVMAVAEKFGATPFDADGAALSHQDGCTFDTLLNTFDLTYAPLSTLANLVRAADLGQLDEMPEAAGLLAISVGLSRQYKDDTEQLEAGLAVYDALFAWARDGQDERHTSELSA